MSQRNLSKGISNFIANEKKLGKNIKISFHTPGIAQKKAAVNAQIKNIMSNPGK